MSEFEKIQSMIDGLENSETAKILTALLESINRLYEWVQNIEETISKEN